MAPDRSFRQVIGIYADGEHRVLNQPGLGVTYTISDPGVATTDESGRVTATSPGYAYFTTEVGLAKAYMFVEVKDGSNGPGVPRTDVAGQFDIQRSGFRYDPKTGRYAQDLVVRNTSSVPVSKTVVAIVMDLPPRVELVNKNFRTRSVSPLGSPSVLLQAMSDTDSSFVEPGESARATLEFRNPEGASIDYTLRIYVGDNL